MTSPEKTVLTRIDRRVTAIVKHKVRRLAVEMRIKAQRSGSKLSTSASIERIEQLMSRKAQIHVSRIKLIAGGTCGATAIEINMLAKALGLPKAFFYNVKEETLDDKALRWAKDLNYGEEVDRTIVQELKRMYLDLHRENPLR